MCVLSGGDGAWDEATENLSLECGNSECSKKISKQETLTVCQMDKLNRRITVVCLSVFGKSSSRVWSEVQVKLSLKSKWSRSRDPRCKYI